jgi:hypothetical protein
MTVLRNSAFSLFVARVASSGASNGFSVATSNHTTERGTGRVFAGGVLEEDDARLKGLLRWNEADAAALLELPPLGGYWHADKTTRLGDKDGIACEPRYSSSPTCVTSTRYCLRSTLRCVNLGLYLKRDAWSRAGLFRAPLLQTYACKRRAARAPCSSCKQAGCGANGSARGYQRASRRKKTRTARLRSATWRVACAEP